MVAKRLAIFVFLAVIVQSAFAATAVQVYVAPSFRLSDKISFSYSITPDFSGSMEYAAYVLCEKAPAPVIEVKNENVFSGQVLDGAYDYLTVNESFEPQACRAIVEILSPSETAKSKEFEIIAKPSLIFSAFACMDENCENRSSVFAV